MPVPKRLIYVDGLGRSGSTRIGQIMAQSDGAENLGEFLRFTTVNDLSRKETGAVDVRELPCGCGLRGADCPDYPLTQYLNEYGLKKGHVWFSLSSPRLPNGTDIADYLNSIHDFLSQRDSLVLIDTSKNARILSIIRESQQFSDWDIRGLFIYRDLPSVFKSWRKEKGYLKKKSVLHIIGHMIIELAWAFWVLFRHRDKDLFISYRSLRCAPGHWVEVINSQLGLNIGCSGNIVRIINMGHEVAGNPSKLDHDQYILIR